MKRLLLLPFLVTASSLLAQAPVKAPAYRADHAAVTVQSFSRQNGNATLNQSILDPGTEQAPQLFPGELEDVGPQYLVVEKAQQQTWFQFLADVQYFYTSNALLTEKGNTDTGLMLSTVEAAITPPPFNFLGGQAALRAGYRHQMWLYSLDNTANQINNADFDVSTVFVGMRHALNSNWTAGLGLDYNRYLSHDADWTEFYTDLTPSWGIERLVTTSEKSSLTFAYGGSYHWTQTDPAPVKHINDRLDSVLAATFSWELVSQIYLQSYYRFQWSHYTENSDRNDIYNTFGLGLNYQFSNWGAIKASVTYENRNSTDDLVADYSKWDTGGGLSLVFQF